MPSDSPSDPNSDSSSDAPNTPSTDFVAVSKKMRGWSSNLIASGLVLVIALTFGRQMLGWWRSAGENSPSETSNSERLNSDKNSNEAAAPVTPGGRSLGLLGGMHQMQFHPAAGNLGRVTWTGNAASAMKQLSNEAIKALSLLEPSSTASASSVPLTPAQQRLMDDLRNRTPVATTPGGGKVYELPGPVPLVVGIQVGKNSEEASSSPPSVVFWGLAAPVTSADQSANDRWTLFTYTPIQEHTSNQKQTSNRNEIGGGSFLPPLSLPHYMQTSMSITAVDEVSMLGLYGPSPLTRWRTYFEMALPEAGYQPEGEWRQSAVMESRRFIKRATQRGEDAVFCDVQLVTVSVEGHDSTEKIQPQAKEKKVQAMLTAGPLLSATKETP